MSRERELLERAYYVLGELSYAMLKDSGEYSLSGDIYEFLSTPEQTQDEEPVAWTCQDELNALGTDVTCYMYAEPLVGENNIPLYLHPAPRPEFVRLSEEEIMAIVRADPDFDEMMWDKTAVRFARAIEDALEEKNKRTMTGGEG